MSTVLVTGNTYPVKDQIKALGGRWDANAKGWKVPAAKADAARRLVSGAPRTAYVPAASRSSGGKWSGCACGSIAGQPRSSDCSSCRFDEFDN